MDEENKKEIPKEEVKSVLDMARELRDQIKLENDRREAILRKEEAIEANRLLSGTAGIRQEPVVKVETSKEYANRVMSGKLKND
jgi:hypothetical protein